MIDDIHTYKLKHLLLFTEETYLRYFEIYNEKYWPFFLLGLLLSTYILFFWKGTDKNKGRAFSFLLFLSWEWIAFFFFYRHFSDINWASKYLAWMFFLGGASLFTFGVMKNSFLLKRKWFGMGIIIIAVYIFPLGEGLWRGSLTSVSLPFISPTPTALLTIGFMTFLPSVKGLLPFILSVVWIIWSTLVAYAFF